VVCDQLEDASNHRHSMLCPRDHAEELICHGFVAPLAASDRPAGWSASWRDDVTGAGMTRDEAIAWATDSLSHLAAARDALREIGRFAKAHHGDEDPNVWLHALVVDIQDMVERATRPDREATRG
jgi:hypothetical protein